MIKRVLFMMFTVAAISPANSSTIDEWSCSVQSGMSKVHKTKVRLVKSNNNYDLYLTARSRG